jgi:O-methyltransferase/methyltransferase family protein
LNALTTDHVLQLGFGFWASKTVLSGIELGVFSQLARSPGTLDDLQAKLGLHPRSARDFLDALVALKLLRRHDGVYSNAEATDLFFDPTKLSYIGGILEIANAQLYGLWGSLSDSLRTGRRQDERQDDGAFQRSFMDPQRLRMFLSGMNGLSVEPAKQIVTRFDWASHGTFMDVSSGQAMLPVLVARAHPHLEGLAFSPPQVQPLFEDLIARHDLLGRVRFHAGDAFRDPWPNADVIVMGYFLQFWGLARKTLLLRNAFEALPKGGALIVYDAIIDDERRENAWPLLASLNMLIQSTEGFTYTAADCRGWMREAGFKATLVERLTGIVSMVIGFK